MSVFASVLFFNSITFSLTIQVEHIYLKKKKGKPKHCEDFSVDFRPKCHTHHIFSYANMHIIYSYIKPVTWLEEMLAEQLSNNIMEAYLSASIEEMLM